MNIISNHTRRNKHVCDVICKRMDKVPRRLVFRSVLLMTWLLFSSEELHAQRSSQTPARPNIVFILTDDLGYTDLGCYGNPYHKTPHIDSLAQRGIRFKQAYVASPICSPSRAAIMTGKHPARLHLTNFLVGERTDPSSPVKPAPWAKEGLSGSEVTLAELMKKQGYATGMVGKWHLGSKEGQTPAHQGFDYDRVISKNGLDYYNYTITARNETVFEDNGASYLTDKLTDYGVEFIEQNKDRPFFLYMAYSAPHVMIIPRGDKLRKYLLEYNKYEQKHNPDYVSTVASGPGIPMDEYRARFNPYYAAMLESMDDGVGRIMEKLNALGLDENTIVVFTSDNGGVGLPELGPVPTRLDPLRMWKGHMYEGGVRVPLIASWPGRIQANSTTDQYITGTDHLPTFMELLNVDQLPPQMDGRSYLKTLLEPGITFDRGPIFWHYPHFSNQGSRPAGAMRLGDYKLVESYETGKVELYDLKNDISEKNDLSAVMPGRTREMAAMLKKWRDDIGANMPVPNPDYNR